MLQKIKISNRPKTYVFVLGKIIYFFGEAYKINKTKKVIEPLESKRKANLNVMLFNYDKIAKASTLIDSAQVLENILHEKKNHIGKILLAHNGFYLDELEHHRNKLVSDVVKRIKPKFKPTQLVSIEKKLSRYKQNDALRLEAEKLRIERENKKAEKIRRAKEYAKKARAEQKRLLAVEMELKQHAKDIEKARIEKANQEFIIEVENIKPYLPKTIDRINLSNIGTIKQYLVNKEVKMREPIVCPICSKSVSKASKEHVFCSIKCKDNFWNHANLRKYNNA